MPAKLEEMQRKAHAIHSQVIRSETFLKGIHLSLDTQNFELEKRIKMSQELKQNLSDFYSRLLKEVESLKEAAQEMTLGVSRAEVLAYVDVSSKLMKELSETKACPIESLSELIAHADRMLPLLQVAAMPKKKRGKSNGT